MKTNKIKFYKFPENKIKFDENLEFYLSKEEYIFYDFAFLKKYVPEFFNNEFLKIFFMSFISVN